MARGSSSSCATTSLRAFIGYFLLAPARLAVVLDVPTEGAGGGELAQLVPDHGLGDEHRDVLAAVVHRDGVSKHVRDDRRPAGPGLDHGLLAGLVERVHLL